VLAHRLLTGGRRLGSRWGRWWGDRSPLNRCIDWYGAVARLDARTLNADKLLFCGQFAFVARRAAA
jgi:hypothetical protein